MVWSAIPANAERKARPPCSRQPCQPSLYFLPREKMFGNGTLLIINLPWHSDSPGRAEAGQGFSKSTKWMAGFQHLWAWLEHISNDRQTLRCQKRSFTVLCLSFPSYLCHAHCRFFRPLKRWASSWSARQTPPLIWCGSSSAIWRISGRPWNRQPPIRRGRSGERRVCRSSTRKWTSWRLGLKKRYRKFIHY